MPEKQNNVINYIVMVALIAIILLILFYNTNKQNTIYSNSLGTNQILKNSITVNGFYSTEVQPDQSEIFINVKTENTNSITAQRENAETANSIIRALKGNGIKEEDIETISYNVELIQEWDPGMQKFVKTGIRVTNSIKIKTEDLEDIGKILDAVIGISASDSSVVEITSVQFTLSLEKQREVNKLLLGKAAENARSKAEGIADSLDLSIVKVLSVSESNVYIPTPYYAQRGIAVEMSVAAAPTPISPSSVTSSATVSVVFEIA